MKHFDPICKLAVANFPANAGPIVISLRPDRSFERLRDDRLYFDRHAEVQTRVGFANPIDDRQIDFGLV
jgi:hypothetical protein